MKKRTKELQISKEVYFKILERDKGCIFCQIYYNMHPQFPNIIDCKILDAMHFISKAKGGLGIEQNLVIGCRYHHSLLDNGNKGLHKEMREVLERYLRDKYPNWNKEDLVFRKE